MSLYDIFSPNLPKLGQGAVSDSLISYATAPITNILSEGMTKVSGVFNGTGPFSKITGNAPTFASIDASSALQTIGSSNPYATNSPFSALSQVVTVPTSTVSATSIKQATNVDSTIDNTSHKVKLIASVNDSPSNNIVVNVNFPFESNNQQTVEFDIMPEVQESITVEYEPVQTAQLIGEFQKYKGTKARTWTIAARFGCRTRDEAKRNYIALNNLRGWSMAYFGEDQRIQFAASNKLGAPPPVLTFSGWRGLVGPVPTVITSLSWSFPEDCDWIPTGLAEVTGAGGAPFHPNGLL